MNFILVLTRIYKAVLVFEQWIKIFQWLKSPQCIRLLLVQTSLLKWILIREQMVSRLSVGLLSQIPGYKKDVLHIKDRLWKCLFP